MFGVEHTDSATYRSKRRPLPRVRWVVVEVVAVTLIVGLIAGLVWSRIAPDVSAQVFEDGAGVSALEGQKIFSRDAVFGIVCAVSGGLLALVYGIRFRRRPITTLVSLTIAGVGAAALAMLAGGWFGPSESVEALSERAEVGDSIKVPLELDSYGAILTWPLAVAFVTLVVALVLDDRTSWGRVRPIRIEPW